MRIDTEKQKCYFACATAQRKPKKLKCEEDCLIFIAGTVIHSLIPCALQHPHWHKSVALCLRPCRGTLCCSLLRDWGVVRTTDGPTSKAGLCCVGTGSKTWHKEGVPASGKQKSSAMWNTPRRPREHFDKKKMHFHWLLQERCTLNAVCSPPQISHWWLTATFNAIA